MEKQSELENVFKKIDDYELLINCMKKSCVILENRFDQAEKEISLKKTSNNSIGKVLSMPKLLTNKLKFVKKDEPVNENKVLDLISSEKAFNRS